MWMPAGVRRREPGLAAARGGWLRNRRMIQISQTTTRAMIATGRSAMSAPQSGVTSLAVTSRNQFQMSSSIGRSAQAGVAAVERVTRANRR